jgi:thiosulfate sulfurtransferase
MPEPVSFEQLSTVTNPILIDVRKTPARVKSGVTMPDAIWRRPFLAENWWQEFIGQNIVVFCVHGHEVSKAVAGFLVDQGIEARYLEGGFEAYRAAGGAVLAINGNE